MILKPQAEAIGSVVPLSYSPPLDILTHSLNEDRKKRKGMEWYSQTISTFSFLKELL